MTAVWGVDVAVAHLAFAFADVHSDQVDVETLILRTDLTEGARLGFLHTQISAYARQTASRWSPACVWVEQSVGRFAKPQLHYAAGVLQAALSQTLGCAVWTIPTSTWKQRTVGKGNAGKPEVQEWCRGQRHGFDSEHEADAVAIACAGRAMYLARSWEAAA